jgi:HAMP domain-containing protein
MKIQHGVLSSRAGRRIFWTLLLAAAAPILLFAAATYGLLSENFQSQARKQQVQLTKFAGMGLLDRLLVARTALDLASRNGGLDPDASSPNRRGRVLLEVAQLDAQGVLRGGAAALAKRWRDRVVAWAARSQGDGATLMLGSGVDETGARPVLMALRRVDQPGLVWIAQIDAAFLFSELAADASGERICVFEALKQPVFCAGWNDEQSGPASYETGNAASRPSWNLFMRPDFGIDDWTLVSMDATPDVAPDSAALARLSALGAVATVLLVGMLGLIQVRRTLVPLERLIAGTRRLSERDFDARVDVQVDDEFGELARSFNHMAERIGSQVQALHVQSSIDHEILNGLNVARVLQRVAQRLEQLMPGAVAAVVELDRRSRMLAHVHTAGAPLCVVSVPAATSCACRSCRGTTMRCARRHRSGCFAPCRVRRRSCGCAAPKSAASCSACW